MLLSQVWQMTDALSEPIIIMNIFFWWHSPFSDDGNLPQNASLHAFGWTSCSPHGFTEIVCGTMHAERLHTHHRRELAKHYCYTAMGQYRALPKYGRWTPLQRLIILFIVDLLTRGSGLGPIPMCFQDVDWNLGSPSVPPLNYLPLQGVSQVVRTGVFPNDWVWWRVARPKETLEMLLAMPKRLIKECCNWTWEMRMGTIR